ncbi:MAG: hypothetical protein WA160_09945 [Pseudobdellovibrio sp.]
MKMTLKSLILTGLLINVLGSFANATVIKSECISKAEMTEIASNFKQFQNIAQADYCLDGSQTSNLLTSILFMRKTAFDSDMKKSSDELFSGRFATSWYKYFTGRIEDMTVEASCPKGVGAYVMGFGGKQMHVCPMILTDNFSALDRASVFMHEARHIDGFPHITCSVGPRKGIQGACDTTMAKGGSYSVSVETYAQLAKYATDLHPALKAYARASAITYADEAFETPVRILRDPQLLIMTQSKDFLATTLGSNQFENMGQSPSLGRIALRAQHMILFPEDKNLTAKYVFVKDAGDISQAAGDAAIEYNGQTAAQRSEFVDLHLATQWNAKIYKTKIAFSCSASSEALSEISFKGTQAIGILHLNGYDRMARSGYVMTDNGTLYEFGCTEKATSFLNPSPIKFDQNYKRIYKIAEMVVGLTMDGHLMEIKNGKSTPIQTPVDGQIFEIVPRQTYAFFDLTIF